MNNAKPNIVADTFKILILNIGNHYFGAPIESIQDVIQRNPTTPVPLTPPNIIGLLNLRGHIVTEIDVAYTLGIHNRDWLAGNNGYSIVINRGGEMYSLVFEGIGDVVDVMDSSIERLPDTINRKWFSISRGVCRMGDKLVVLLDFNLMIDHLTPEPANMV